MNSWGSLLDTVFDALFFLCGLGIIPTVHGANQIAGDSFAFTPDSGSET